MATAARKTASTHRTAVLRGTHQLDIIGYSRRRRLGTTDNTVRSGSFEVGGFLWALVCRFQENPAGAKGVTLASIFLELSRNETDEAVVAAASVRIDDPSGTGRWLSAEWCSEESNVFPRRSRRAVAWELAVPDAFREHEARYVDADADRLTLHCVVDVFREESAEGATSWNCQVSVPPPPSLGKDIQMLREKMWWPDVTFVVDETKIQAHKLVLAMRSPVFAAEFRGGMKERTTQSIRVADMSASTFRAMLHFIYTDELPKPKKKGCRLAMAQDLLEAADLYDLERLRLMCENILSESITVDNLMATLMLVHNRHSCHQLEASCVSFMASYPDAYNIVEATEEYKELDAYNMPTTSAPQMPLHDTWDAMGHSQYNAESH
jgi:speckle-type POZ protein